MKGGNTKNIDNLRGAIEHEELMLKYVSIFTAKRGETKVAKLQTFYGIWTTDDERHGSIKAYASTKDLAEDELKNHRDFWNSNPPTPDEKHIIPLQMIVDADETKKKEFVLERVTDRIFIIVTKDQFNETVSMYCSLPMIVHGLLKVEGTSFDKSYISYMHISDEVSVSKQFDSLAEKARAYVFPQNN